MSDIPVPRVPSLPISAYRLHKEKYFRPGRKRKEGHPPHNNRDIHDVQKPELKESLTILSSVEELFISGGGGAGRTLPGAFKEATKFGLDMDKVKVVCGTSVGTIVALGIALGVPIDGMTKVLSDMPTDDFQDWNIIESILKFPVRWGICRGEAMPNYFKLVIKELTGLEDPTFQELYDAGYRKELRIVTTNLDKGDITVFSHKTTPHKKVASTVALSCSVPILYPPQWIVSPDGKRELHTDGGVLKNYPFGVGSDAKVPLEKQLGFIFVNGATARKLNGEQKPFIQSFIQYLATLLSAIVFQHPLTLPEPVKQRTVAIRVNHNPFRFSATPEEQRMLDEAGAQGVRSLVLQMIKRQQDGFQVALRQAYHEQSKQQERTGDKSKRRSGDRPRR